MLEIPERGWIDVKGEVRGATAAEGRGEKEKMKKVKPSVIRTELAVLVRKSPRLAKSVAPEYREVTYYERILPRSASCPRRDLSNRVYASNKDRDVATVKAKKLEASLESNIPTFVRSMLLSHVSSSFWRTQKIVHATRAAAATATLAMIALSLPNNCFEGSKSDVNGASITIKVFEVEELSNPNLLYPSLEPGRSVSVGWSKLCQSGAVELSLINTKFPSSPRVASTELMSFAVILVDHTKFCGAPLCVITRLPSRILSLAEAIAAEGSGATLFATQTTACGEMFLYQIPT
nr:B3 domain-containing protein At5g42700-like [Ipomoea batatas]